MFIPLTAISSSSLKRLQISSSRRHKSECHLEYVMTFKTFHVLPLYLAGYIDSSGDPEHSLFPNG